MRSIEFLHLGLTPYGQALELQHELHLERVLGRRSDTVLILEHTPVITLGRHGDESNVVASADYLQKLGVELFRAERGGEATFHGPGQLVAYVIVDLKHKERRIAEFVHTLQQSMIDVAASFGITAMHGTKNPGVWVGNDKLGAIGLRIKDGVSFHGIALNVNVNLQYFDLIVPCGLRNKGVTSISRLLGKEVDMDRVRTLLEAALDENLSKFLQSR